MTTRREFLKGAAAASAGVAVASGLAPGAFGSVLGTTGAPALIDAVKAACRRLAPHGWRKHLLDVTGGALDIGAADLRSALATTIGTIDRTAPGFGDFSLAGTRAIEPGRPAQSLLYHALASPGVVADRTGAPLTDFATLAEIEAVENFVYAAQHVTLDDLRARAAGRPLGIVVYALGYRNAAASVHGLHADLCFARTGIARLGTAEPHYNRRERSFDAYDITRPALFRVVPQRFAAFIAMKSKGDSTEFGPQDFLDGDEKLEFWVPLHKLFDGRECIAGRDLRVDLRSHLRNEKLRRFHRSMEIGGFTNEWTGDDLDKFPFTIKDVVLGAISQRADFGSGMLEPKPHPLATPATFRNQPLTFTVDRNFTSKGEGIYFSSMQVLPAPPDTAPAYFGGTAQGTDRPSPEYLNARHPVVEGKVGNINRNADLKKLLHDGGYKTLHYIDYAGDGWVEVQCPQLAADLPRGLPAFSLIAPPDFFPKIGQREMMAWWKNDVPAALRDGLWAIPPLALSQQRMAADITLPIGFSIADKGMTAIVSQPTDTTGAAQRSNGPLGSGYSGLPDASPGLFDPGWDASQGIYFTDPDAPTQHFLQGYGLGSPFVEDIKLCAALGSYWPAVAPDNTRTFAPVKRGTTFDYPWPSIAPLTDEETGIVPMRNGKIAPWDGVRGPRLRQVAGRTVAVYADIDRVDYIDSVGSMTGAYLAQIGIAEYQARILSLAQLYWSLGIHDAEVFARHQSGDPLKAQDDRENAIIEILLAKAHWAVLSFRAVTNGNPELAEAERVTANQLEGTHRFRFHLFRPGAQIVDPDDIGNVLVDVGEQVIAYADAKKILLRRDDASWQCDTSIPTS